MKALIVSLLFFFSLTFFNAQETEENRFQQSENAATGTANTGSAIGGVGGEQEAGVGNPSGEEDPLPIPIDDNLPLLVVMGASIAVYHFRKKMMIKTK